MKQIRISIRPLLSALTAILTALAAPSWGQIATSFGRIPTLGGSCFSAYDLNASGQLTGFSYVTDNTGSDAFLYSDGVTADLGTLGGFSSEGYAINSSGQIVGSSYVDPSDWYECHGFLYDGVQLIDLGTLGGYSSSAIDINDAGQVVGTSLIPGNSIKEAFLYEDGTMVGLGDLGGYGSEAVAINNLGTIIGNSQTSDLLCHAFVYTNGIMFDPGTLGGGSSSATALNDANMVIGDSQTSTGQRHAFLYFDGVMTDLGTLGGTYSSAQAINNAGQVIGLSTTADNQTHGFVYSGGSMTDLGTLGGAGSAPTGINSLGQVVGYSSSGQGVLHAFLWQNGAISDLNSLIPADSGWVLESAEFINDSGLIVGYGSLNGNWEWFAMTVGSDNSVDHPPVANAGPDQIAECGNPVTLDGSQSTDPDDDSLTFEWSLLGSVLASGPKADISLPLGANEITLKVTDPSGQSSTDTVLVTIVDTLPPAGSCPDAITASADLSGQAAVPDLATKVNATDNCTPAGDLVISQEPAAGTIVGTGSYQITITVADACGNTAHCVVPFNVKDTTPPAIQAVTATPDILSPPNHDLIPVTVSVLALDAGDPAPVSRIVSITCNETLALGETEITGDLTANLAASREGSGDGRVYTLNIECVDASGNVSTGATQVFVPRGNGNGGANPNGKGR